MRILTLKKFMGYAFVRGLSALLLSVLIAAVCITVDGLRDRIPISDLAIVPGNTIDPDGSPSKRLRGRLDKAIELYRAKRCTAILVSGALGREGFDESEVMKIYLLKQGVDSRHIFIDHQGTTTFETARFAAQLIRERGFKNPIVVTQFFHVPRCKLALKKWGISQVGSAHADYFELRDAYSTFREVFAYGAYAFKKRNTENAEKSFFEFISFLPSLFIFSVFSVFPFFF
jgi:vancomycin permeability regulator SanA